MDKEIPNDKNTIENRLTKLIEANHYLADNESLESLFPKLLKLAKSVTLAEASSLMLYNPKRNELEFASVADEIINETGKEQLKKTVTLKLGEGIAGWVAENRKAIIIEDAQQDARFSDKADKQTGFFTRTLLSVPLVYGEELLGVINVLNAKNKSSFDAEDQAILESFSHLAAVAIIRSRLLESRLKQARFQVELKTASKIQSLFWPKLPDIGGDSHIWAVSVPATLVGGDLYDITHLTDNSWLIYVADVSGKGLPAALIMVALWSKIRAETYLHNDIDRMLEVVNDAICDLMADEGFFATIILGRYWPATGKMQLVRGGHLPPIRLSSDGVKNVPELKGPALGVASKIEYKKEEIELLPGESILFFTDGITEAENDRSELFGHHNLIKSLQQTDGPPWGKKILNSVNSWRGSALINDDLTVLEIWREAS